MERKDDAGQGNERLLTMLERLLEIDATEIRAALFEMSQLLAHAFGADKVDIVLYDASIDSLVAMGTSDTPLGRKQRTLGLDRMPIANGGREVAVFQSGESHVTGHAEQDPAELVGLVRGLGIRSSMIVPLVVGGVRRGLLLASSTTPERFSERDLRVLEAAARWVGMVAHRAELVEQLAREAVERGRRAAADELVTVVAHDLRNYLTPLKARVDLLLRRARRRKNQDDVKDAEVASRELDRLAGMIGNLLDAARLEEGVFGVTPQPVDLVTLVRETAAGLATAETPIALAAPEELVVQTDPDRLRQALENVLANAVRHSPPGAPVEVTVRHELDDAGREQAIVTVRDRGRGIPPELLPRLFERFAAGANRGGLGLGLYLAQRIAVALGGSLAADSSPGQGASFHFTLPLDGPDR